MTEILNVENSTRIKTLTYHSKEEKLCINFIKGGSYQYLKVPYAIWHAFKLAKSKGEFFNKFIKPKFKCKKIEI